MTTDKAPVQEQEVPTLADFLESVPPNAWTAVRDFAADHPRMSTAWLLATPDLRLFCADDACNGYRFFATGQPSLLLEPGKGKYSHVTYRCRNCQRSTKVFSLWISFGDPENAKILKFGEWPEFGPSTPSRVIKLIGPDRELFLKGRRSENQGLGIGAFGYYRRVVENQKNRILGEIIKVSAKLGADQALLEELQAAETETQFTKAVDHIKHAIPQALLITDHNPLTLLHAALSEGLHVHSDEECLALATSIRWF